jgi:hypothetical protein
MIEFSERYVTHFRQHLGGCDSHEASRNRVYRLLSTDDLFCLPGVEPEYEETKEDDEEAEVAEAIVKSTEPPVEGLEPDARAAKKATVETEEEIAAQAGA